MFTYPHVKKLHSVHAKIQKHVENFEVFQFNQHREHPKERYLSQGWDPSTARVDQLCREVTSHRSAALP
jgi:hypothetical protein